VTAAMPPLLRRVTAGPWPVLLVVVLVAAGLRMLDANPASAQTASLVAWRVDSDPGMDASTGVWTRVPGVDVALSAQTSTFPQGGVWGGPRPPTAEVKALHDGDSLYVAIRWWDGTVNDRADKPEAFADAAAVQFPSSPGSSVPAICMGQADQSVNIWQWRADSQVGVPAEPAGGYVDGYPSTTDLFYPAREAGNPYAAPGAGAVQNLVAGGFGTLAPVGEQVVTGHGVRPGDNTWSTVFRRDHRAPGELQPTFDEGQTIDIAFAVWDGGLDHRDGIKSVTSFVRLDISSDPVPANDGPWRVLGWIVFVLLLAGLARWLLAPAHSTRTAT
jgi:hypothetical protein